MVRPYHQFCDIFWSLTGLITDQCLLMTLISYFQYSIYFQSVFDAVFKSACFI